MSADTVVAAVGTFFAAVAALVSSRYAKQSSEAGRDAVEELERSRLLAERERRREDLVGELIEQLVPFVWRQGLMPQDQYQQEWERGTVLLRQSLVGFGQDELVECRGIAREGGRRVYEASRIGQARWEINAALAAPPVRTIRATLLHSPSAQPRPGSGHPVSGISLARGI